MFFIEFFDKKFYFVILNKVAKTHYQTVFIPKLLNDMCFVFHAKAFDDAMTFEYLKS